MRILTGWGYDHATDNWTVPKYSHGPWWVCMAHWIGARGMSLYIWADKRLDDDWEEAP